MNLGSEFWARYVLHERSHPKDLKLRIAIIAVDVCSQARARQSKCLFFER